MARANSDPDRIEPIEIDRAAVLRFRFERHDLHRSPGSMAGPADLALLDYGVQDTGPDGAPWAMTCRGLDTSKPDARELGHDLVLAWTLRGAPHAYRRADLDAVVVATSPFDETDAAKRIFDASKPLRDAKRPVLEALATISRSMSALVESAAGGELSKGEMSAALAERVDPVLLRWCRPCEATHIYEQSFRISALQAGLELVPGTSPPVMRQAPEVEPPHWSTSGADAAAPFHVVRNYLRFFGPATPKQAATFLDSPVKVIKDHWPSDTVTVIVTGRSDDDSEGGPADILVSDHDHLIGSQARSAEPVVRLLGPYDPYLQLRDRTLLVPDEAHRKDLWRILGRPGAIVVDGDVVGTWRPRASGRKLTVAIDPWRKITKALRTAVDDEAERLATHRGVSLAAVSL